MTGASQVQAQTCEPVPVQTALNSDGSRTLIQTVCPEPDLRRISIELKSAQGELLDRHLIDQTASTTPFGGVRLVDIIHGPDKEVEVSGTCGGSADCEYDIYRLDIKRSKLQPFLRANYSDLKVHDSWIVTFLRSGCCGLRFNLWEFDVESASLLDAEDVPMIADVGWFSPSLPFDCAFSRKIGEQWLTVAAPSAKIEKLICGAYGDEDYRIAPLGLDIYGVVDG